MPMQKPVRKLSPLETGLRSILRATEKLRAVAADMTNKEQARGGQADDPSPESNARTLKLMVDAFDTALNVGATLQRDLGAASRRKGGSR